MPGQRGVPGRALRLGTQAGTARLLGCTEDMYELKDNVGVILDSFLRRNLSSLSLSYVT